MPLQTTGLTFRAFTRYGFPDRVDAVRLLQTFVDHGREFTPAAFDTVEPIRRKFDAEDLDTPAALLTSAPRELLLKRQRPNLLASIRWLIGRRRPWSWTIWFGDEPYGSESFAAATLVPFLLDVTAGFPPVFAFCSSNTDLDAKHTLRSPTTNEWAGERGLFMEPQDGLPGVYWFTFFGAELVTYFGRGALLTIEADQAIDCGASGVAVVLHSSPSAGSAGSRRDRERDVVERLGEEFFFDAALASDGELPARTPIPGVTDES
jgi:hypothetical protein